MLLKLLAAIGCLLTSHAWTTTSLGDIMGGRQHWSLDRFPNPLDRIVLTANGNLQRLLASYAQAPVTVEVLSNRRTNETAWERLVHLQVRNETWCVATSTVVVHDEHWREWVDSGTAGLGQLFRYANVLPEFELLAAGRLDNGSLWRNYTLACPQMVCEINEVFIPNVWSMGDVSVSTTSLENETVTQKA